MGGGLDESSSEEELRVPDNPAYNSDNDF